MDDFNEQRKWSLEPFLWSFYLIGYKLVIILAIVDFGNKLIFQLTANLSTLISDSKLLKPINVKTNIYSLPCSTTYFEINLILKCYSNNHYTVPSRVLCLFSSKGILLNLRKTKLRVLKTKYMTLNGVITHFVLTSSMRQCCRGAATLH